MMIYIGITKSLDKAIKIADQLRDSEDSGVTTVDNWKQCQLMVEDIKHVMPYAGITVIYFSKRQRRDKVKT